MKKRNGIAAAVLVAVGFTAGSAYAQCAFEHPSKTRAYDVGLVQTFVNCGGVGGNTINATTINSVPSCVPTETFREQSGSPADGWRWSGEKSTGRLRLIPRLAVFIGTNDTPILPAVPNTPLNPPGTRDVRVRLSLSGIIADDSPDGANGSGVLALVVRFTFDDPVGSDMTVVDYPISFPFFLTDGATALDTSFDAVLNSIAANGLPRCTSIELLSAQVLDENGDPFAVPGLFLRP